jgi:hypothetical protein
LNQEETKDFHQEHHFPKPRKTPKIEHLYTRIWEGNHKEKNHERLMHTSPIKSQRERPQIPHKKITKKNLQKSPKRENGRDTITA